MEVNFSLIGDSMVVQGNIVETHRLLVNGIVNGNIESNHDVILCGEINGNVKAKNLYIKDGCVNGNVQAETIYCDNIELAVSKTCNGKLLPYKMFNRWEKEYENNGKDIFDDLEKDVNCECISNFRQKDNILKIKQYIKNCNINNYSLKSWKDLHEYLLEKTCDKGTRESVCLSIVASI